MANATMPAITHVAVTVTDLAASEAWYTKVLGVTPVLDEDTGPFRHIVYQIGNTLFGLHGFPDLASTEPFNERKPGLDHIAFGVASRDELAEWAARLDELGVACSDIVDASYGSGLSFRDPDNIALELFAPPARVTGDGELLRPVIRLSPSVLGRRTGAHPNGSAVIGYTI